MFAAQPTAPLTAKITPGAEQMQHEGGRITRNQQA
jgi:hypothetical protein